MIGSLGYILAVLGRGTCPKGEKMAAACPGLDSQDLATILDPFPVIFVDLGPPIRDLNIVTLPQLRLLRFQHWHRGDF